MRRRHEGTEARRHGGVWCGTVLVLSCVLLSACGAGGPKRIVRTGPPPGYADAAARYNARVERVSHLIGQVTGTIEFRDEEGDKRREEFSGVLQISGPERVALSIKKVGQRVAWVGGDGARAWLIEFGDETAALVGSHEVFARVIAGEEAASGGGGLAPVAPRDLAALLGVAPLPAGVAGATQWSSDGRWIGLTTRIRDASGRAVGLRRVWADPETMVAQRVEVFDAAKERVVWSELEGEGRVTLSGDFGERPRLAQRVTIRHERSGSLLTLGMGSMRDGPMEEEAFDFDALARRFGVERVEELDWE